MEDTGYVIYEWFKKYRGLIVDTKNYGLFTPKLLWELTFAVSAPANSGGGTTVAKPRLYEAVRIAQIGSGGAFPAQRGSGPPLIVGRKRT